MFEFFLQGKFDSTRFIGGFSLFYLEIKFQGWFKSIFSPSPKLQLKASSLVSIGTTASIFMVLLSKYKLELGINIL